MELQIGNYLLDTEAVRALTEAREAPAGGCDCAYCRNFLAAIEALPTEVGAFLDKMGLDLRKPHEVAENGKEEDGRRWYTAWYHLPGKILAEGEEITLTEDCFCHFQTFCHRLPEGFPRPSFQLNVDLCLPWVLEGPDAKRP